MQEEKYYKEITTIIEDIEVNTKVRQFQDNTEKLQAYWTIGKLIVEAQSGVKKSKYGAELIKKWSILLSKIYGKNYGKSNMFNMRQFYLLFPKFRTLCGTLTWSHYRYLLPIKNENERNYYINQVILNNLSVRELINEIKNKAFDRLSYADKENIKLIENDNYTVTIKDMIKDPIILKADNNINSLDEKAIHKYLINMLENRFLELGQGFALVGHEYKILLNNRSYKIDLLFFNAELNCYVVVEIKSRELKNRDISQLDFYVNYIDKNIRRKFHNKTVGLLVVKKNNHYVIEYTTSKDIFVTTYKLI